VTYAVIIVLSLLLVIVGVPLIIKMVVGLVILVCHDKGQQYNKKQTKQYGVVVVINPKDQAKNVKPQDPVSYADSLFD